MKKGSVTIEVLLRVGTWVCLVFPFLCFVFHRFLLYVLPVITSQGRTLHLHAIWWWWYIGNTKLIYLMIVRCKT